MPDLGAIFQSIGQVISKRGSAFTPLLTFNLLVASASFAVYVRFDSLSIFVPMMLVWLYTLYQHEYFSRKLPHMLSSEESVQRLGISLSGFGQKGKEMTLQQLHVLPAEKVDKPMSQKSSQSKIIKKK